MCCLPNIAAKDLVDFSRGRKPTADKANSKFAEVSVPACAIMDA
jgi:hypothetical protein